jgi:hypothetical protein
MAILLLLALNQAKRYQGNRILNYKKVQFLDCL